MHIHRWIPNCRFSASIALTIVLVALTLAKPAERLHAQIIHPADDLSLETPSSEDSDELPEFAPGSDVEPLDLRRATLEQLTSLPGITRSDALAIIDFLRGNRDAGFESLAEIDGLSAENLVVLRTYCTLAPKETRPERRPRISHRLRLRHDLQRRSGYDEPVYRVLDSNVSIEAPDTIPVGTRYLGSPAAITTSIDYNDDALSIHLLMAKDPGEPIRHIDTPSYRYSQFEKAIVDAQESGSRIGPFLGGGIFWQPGDLGIAVGDYSAGSALGLVLASRAEQRRSAIAGNSERPLMLDRSAGEVSYMRGAALGYDSDRLDALIFYSSRTRDARIDTAIIDGTPTAVALSLRDGSVRRTHSDFRSSSSLQERLAGCRLRWSGTVMHAGMTGYHVEYSHPLQPAEKVLWRGSRGSIFSIDGGVSTERFEARAEIARSAAGDIGVAITGAARFESTLLDFDLRVVPAGFSVPHGRSIDPFDPGDGIEAALALRTTPLPMLELDLSFTVRSPLGWSSFSGASRRKQTTDIAVRYSTPGGLGLRLVARRGVTVASTISNRGYLEQYDFEQQIDMAAGLDGEFFPPGSQTRLRCGLLFRGRDVEKGKIFYGDLSHPLYRWLTISGRVTLFQGEIPVYQFEQLLPGWPRSVALSGRGTRFWVKMSAEPFPALRITGFLAQTIYADRAKIAEGTSDEIEGEIAGMAGVQVDLVLDL